MILKSHSPDTLKKWAKWAKSLGLRDFGVSLMTIDKTKPLAATYIKWLQSVVLAERSAKIVGLRPTLNSRKAVKRSSGNAGKLKRVG